MNNKLRSDSVFSQLTPEQVESLEGWLFEENLSYKGALERVRQEFKLEASLTGLRRFYRRLANHRHREDLEEMAGVCAESLREGVKDGALPAGMIMMGTKLAVELAVQAPGKVREFTALLRAITSAQGMEMKRVEFQREEDWRKAEKLKEQQERERAREHARLWNEMNAAREAKRKATIAAKKAAALESTKPQAPSPKEAPNPKLQVPIGESVAGGSTQEKTAPDATDRTDGTNKVDGKEVERQKAETGQRSETVETKIVALRPASGCYRIVGREKT